MSIRVPGWLLIGGSILAALLLIVRVDYVHAVNRERAELDAAQRQINGGPEFEQLWKKLAAATYASGHNDPALMDLLRKCDITGASETGACVPAINPCGVAECDAPH